ncbi:MAG: phosphate ABC transporter substrate-binding protein [Verrucomicrobia bacterium]|nr:phosphate ABC transporter substrate-binding protein [Verrucomicrobiota bacterium]
MKMIPHLAIVIALTCWSNAQTISIKGSDTLGAKLIPQLAEKYKAEGHADVKFEIAAEGSATAFPALANKTAQIGMSSRKAKEEEITDCKTKGVVLKEYPVCFDMLCVIVNKNNPVKNLTKAQVVKVFTGQVKDWSEIGGTPGPVSLYTRNTSSGTYKDWQKMAMDGRDYPASSLKMAGTEQIAQEVAKNKGGIGYVGLAFSETRGTKALNIDGIAPIGDNKKTYAYSRECYLYLPEDATPEATAFLQFVLSPAGQTVITSTGFIHH